MTSYPKRGSTVNPGKLPRCDRATRNPQLKPLHHLTERLSSHSLGGAHRQPHPAKGAKLFGLRASFLYD
ncbi:hypothetical protein [Coleofasciculus chthonoplastes]|uniref:hypothetical protein n=1 Tax=Coleofasciculus chthonoplastes TaxID=64178 RepID=UPI0032FE7C1A